MVVMIAKQNQGFFLEFDSKLTFQAATLNTCTFKISPQKFRRLLNYILGKDLNPYSVMSW